MHCLSNSTVGTSNEWAGLVWEHRLWICLLRFWGTAEHQGVCARTPRKTEFIFLSWICLWIHWDAGLVIRLTKYYNRSTSKYRHFWVFASRWKWWERQSKHRLKRFWAVRLRHWRRRKTVTMTALQTPSLNKDWVKLVGFTLGPCGL